MQFRLHAVINHAGDYQGFSANYSGAGFSGMHFTFRGMSRGDFDRWVQKSRTAPQALDRDAYVQLARPSEREPVHLYSQVTRGLYDAILNQCVATSC
jgi:cytochrome o ubiquinol oxidase subunit 2